MPGKSTRIVYMEQAKDKLCVISTTDNHTYLGVVESEGKIEYAYGIGKGFYRESVGKWMKAYNVGELMNYELRGAVGYRVRPLTMDEKQWVDEAWFNMKKAIHYVQEYMQNQLFDKFESK